MPPSLNGLFPGRGRRFKSKEYENWLEVAGWEIARQRPAKYLGEVSVSLHVQDIRRGDLDNRMKGVLDLLVKHGIIEGDSYKYVREINIKWVTDVKGIRITIKPWS